jgi:hypothetical protein
MMIRASEPPMKFRERPFRVLSMLFPYMKIYIKQNKPNEQAGLTFRTRDQLGLFGWLFAISTPAYSSGLPAA